MSLLTGGSPFAYDPNAESRAHEMIGLKYADNFLDQYNKAKDRAVREKQFDLGKRLAEARMTALQSEQVRAAAELEGLQNKNKLEALGMAKMQAFENKKVDALAFEGTLDGNYDGKGRVSFLRFLQENPDLVDTPWAASLNKRFDTFEVLDKKAQDAEHRLNLTLQSKEDIARIMAEQRAQLLTEREDLSRQNSMIKDALKAQEESGIAGIVDSEGNVDQKKLEEANKIRADLKRPARIRSAEEFGKQLSETRPDLKPEQIREAVTKYEQNPASLNPTNREREALVADDEAARGLDQVAANIQKFNAKFGANAFDKFTGPIEGRIQQFKGNYKGFTSEDERLARSIWSQAEQQIQGYRKGNFGLALTGIEIGRFKRIVDDPESASYLETLGSFRESLKDSVSRRLENFPYAQNVPSRLYSEYGNRKRGEWFMGDSKTNALPSGWKFVK